MDKNIFNSTAKELGYEVTRGVMSYLITLSIIFAMVMLLIASISNHFGWGTDSTDIDGWHRSGLTVHRDALTGVEYVSDGNGGMCVRQSKPESQNFPAGYMGPYLTNVITFSVVQCTNQ